MKYVNFLRSIIYIVVGFFLFFVITPLKVPVLANNIFASFCVLYGGFRFYQAYQESKKSEE